MLKNYDFGPHDCLVVFSSTGINNVAVEIALGGKARGMPVIAVTSVAQSEAGEVSHSSGTRLLENADVVLDLCTPPGDAMIDVEGLKSPIGPGSTLAAVAIVNEIKVRTAELLSERAAMLPVLTSAAVVGREESERLFDAAYGEYARRLAGVLSGGFGGKEGDLLG